MLNGKRVWIPFFMLSLVLGFMYISLAMAQFEIGKEYGSDAIVGIGAVGLVAFLLFITSIVLFWKNRNIIKKLLE